MYGGVVNSMSPVVAYLQDFTSALESVGVSIGRLTAVIEEAGVTVPDTTVAASSGQPGRPIDAAPAPLRCPTHVEAMAGGTCKVCARIQRRYSNTRKKP